MRICDPKLVETSFECREFFLVPLLQLLLRLLLAKALSVTLCEEIGHQQSRA